MQVDLRLTRLVLRADGKYDCEIAVNGYFTSDYVKEVKDGVEVVTGVTNEKQVKLTKGQKIVITVEDADLGEDLCSLMDNVRDYIDDNFAAMRATWDAIEDGTYFEKQQCDAEQCSFPECDHVCGYNPDKHDEPQRPQACEYCRGTGYHAEQSPEASQAAVDRDIPSRYCTCAEPDFQETHPYGWLACQICGKLKE